MDGPQRDRLLITGGNGLLGTKLIGLCLRSGAAEPISVSRQPCANAYLGRFAFYQLDIADAAATRALLECVRPRWVIHTAAMTDVDGCERYPDAAWRANLEGARSVAAACRAVEAHLVHLSTEYVFDGRAGPYAEDAPVNPLSVYGRTKLASELVVRELCPWAAIARTTVLYGYAPNARPNFVTWLIDRLRRGQPVRVVNDQVGSPTLADNLAEMCLTLALAHARGIYHTVGADRLDRYSFALLAAQVFALDPALIEPISTADLRQPAPRPLHAGLLVDKFRREFPGVRILGAREGLETLRAQLPAETRLQ